MAVNRKITKANIKTRVSYSVGLALRYGVEESIILSKIMSFAETRMRDDGFTWCLYDELEEQTGLTRPRIKHAIKSLEEEGFIYTKRAYIKDRQLWRSPISCNHFKINENKSIVIENL